MLDQSVNSNGAYVVLVYFLFSFAGRIGMIHTTPSTGEFLDKLLIYLNSVFLMFLSTMHFWIEKV